MRPLSLLVAAMLFVSQSGCTLVFGVGGAGRDFQKRRAERRAFTLADPPVEGARVLVDMKDGRLVEGVFGGLARAEGDTARTLVVVRTIHTRTPERLRAADARRMWALPRVHGARNGFLFGLAADALVLGVLYALYDPPEGPDAD